MRSPFALLLLTLVLAACGSARTNGTETGNGFVRVELVDAPGDYEAVLVTITRVEAHTTNGRAMGDRPGSPADAAWITLVEEEQTHDLLELRDGAFAVLGERSIPASRYDQIRMIVSSASVTVDGRVEDLTIPSGVQTGIKLNHDFSIESERRYTLVLDFDAAQSVKETGTGYLLEPVLTVARFAAIDE